MELNAPLSELLSDRFFQENTSYPSFEKFLAAGGFYPKTRADIEAIPESEIDAHVAATTNFNDWHEVMQAALKQLLTG